MILTYLLILIYTVTSFFRDFAVELYFGSELFIRQNNIKFVCNRYEKSKTTSHMPKSDIINFDGLFFLPKTRAVLCTIWNQTISYVLILLVFNSKHGVLVGYIVNNLKVNRNKIATARVPFTKRA